MNRKSISNILDIKNNSFNTIGIILAILVVLFHCYPLYYGISNDKTDLFSSFMKGSNLGSIAVAMFFIISGFLITTSLKRSDNTGKYIYKRVKRIFPPLFICLIICAIFLAPILSEIPKGEFIKSPDLYKHYIMDNLFMIKNTVYGIADIFMNNPYPSAINGSIWTLKHQVFLYLLILFLYKLGFIKKGKILVSLYAISTISYLLLQMGYMDSVIINVKDKLGYFGIFNEFDQLVKLTFYFFSGVLINCYMDRIVINKEFIIGSVVLLLIGNYLGKLNYSCMISLPYLTIALASIKSKYKITDVSYEMYIVAFPIQQVIMYYTYGKIDILTYIIISIIVTTIIAVLLHYFVKAIINKIEKLVLN